MASTQSTTFVQYDDSLVEPLLENEREMQEQLFDIIHRTQLHNFSMHRHALRGTHVKSQAVVKGSLTVQPDLPAELAQGICSSENSNQPHPIAIRFANEPSFLQDDRTPGPRGCGMKIFNVEGVFMDAQGKKTRSQDMTFNNAPILELRDLPTTVDIFTIRERHFREPEKIPPELKKRKDAQLQLAPTQLPNKHFLSYTMYSQSAYRWGEYVCKYALFPTGDFQRSLEDKYQVTESSSPEQHSEWLQTWFRGGKDATYDLRVQLLQDLKAQPVEDASVEWDESSYPYRTVAKIVLSGDQESFANQRRAFWDDSMKLNVWYGLEAHRPLGSVNRLRKELYQRSAEFREKTNNTEVVYIDSIDQIP